MASIRDLVESARAELPPDLFARWASILFGLSVLAMLISIAATQALLALAAVVYVLHLFRGRPLLRFPPVKLPLALFCLFSILSVFWAANSAVGWLAVRKLVLFLVWLLAVNLIAGASQLKMLFQGLFLEAALAGLVAAAQFVLQYRAVRALHPHQIYLYMTVERVHGFMGHWMNFGGQQMMMFAALLAFLWLGEKPVKECRYKGSLWWLALGVVAMSIVLNFTRGVWLGCFVAVVYLAARWRARWLLSLPLVFALGYAAAPALVRERVKTLLHPTADPALAIRFEMWRVGLNMIREHPLVGVGPNNIEQVYALYLPKGTAAVGGYHQHLHNNFLQLGAERGLPCLAAWVWLMAALGWHAVRMRRRLVREGRSTWVVDAALASWLAFAVEGCFEFNFGTSPVLMVFLFIMATPFVVERVEREKSVKS